MKKFKTFIDKAFKWPDIRQKIIELHQMPEDFAVPHNSHEFNYFKVIIQVINKKDGCNEI